MKDNYSVLMSVYYKENPEYLYQSMQSIYEQTVKTNNFVLVCDGTLPDALNKVIEEMQQKFGEYLYVHRLPKNGGLGRALNIGLKDCHNELVARMDSDDISRRFRCERELKIFKDNPLLSIVGGEIEEFTENIDNVHGKRIVPEKQAQIIKFAKKRNPFNHVSVMYKKSDVEASGGYQDFYLLEDYFLWIRMLKKGLYGYNIQEPLVFVRTGLSMYKRRGGYKYAISQYNLFKYMKNIGFLKKREYLLQIFIRFGGTIVPPYIRETLYRLILRKRL